LTIVLSVLSTKHYTEGQTIHWPKEKGQTMIYKTLHRRTDNTMANRKRTNQDLQTNIIVEGKVKYH
jgi:hypothetical protein